MNAIISNSNNDSTAVPASTVPIVIPATHIKFEELKIVAKLDIGKGQRLCRIINKGAGNVSVGAIVPSLSNESFDFLLVNETVRFAVEQFIYGVQDKIVRGMLGLKEYANKEIPIDEFNNIQNIINFLEAENESKVRLSKEAIEAWFTADIAPLLVAALKGKGITQQKQLDDTCNAFKNSFAVLAGKQVSMSEQIKNQLEKALLLLPEGYENHVAELVASKLLSVTEAAVVIDAL